MDRFLMADLIEWKDDPYRKPLILSGARQVGKTWLLKEFGNTQFANLAYVNFETLPAASSLFAGPLEAKRLIQGLSAITRETIDPDNTLIVLDEIQLCPRAITALKYLCEDARQYHVACAGSNLGITLRQEGTGYPIGKVDTLTLYPMTFAEYLQACGQTALLDVVTGCDASLIDVLGEELEHYLKQYYFVGGMPEAVERFITTDSYPAVRKVQQSIVDMYVLDIAKHLSVGDCEKTLALWRTIPSQLAKEHKKFQYSGINSNARAREYAFAITWLRDAGLVYTVPRVTEAVLPLDANRDENSFKLFVLDVGILAAMSNLHPEAIVEGNELFTRFKGAITEQYVCQQLIAGNGMRPFYWSQNNPRAEVDFLVEDKGEIYAIEAKAAHNLAAKSLRAFGRRKPYYHLVRASLSKPHVHDCVTEVPLYALQNESLWLDGPNSKQLHLEAQHEKAAKLAASREDHQTSKNKDVFVDPEL